MEPDEAEPGINLKDDDAEFREHAPRSTRNISGLLDDEEQEEAGLSERRRLDNQFLAEREAREAASGDCLSHIEQKYAPSRSPASVSFSGNTQSSSASRHCPSLACSQTISVCKFDIASPVSTAVD
jgi:hypothetical protein